MLLRLRIWKLTETMNIIASFSRDISLHSVVSSGVPLGTNVKPGGGSLSTEIYRSRLDTSTGSSTGLSLRAMRIYLVFELLLLIRVLDEFIVGLVFQFWLWRGVLCHKPGRRHYAPVKDGLRRLFGPVAAITGRGLLQYFLHPLFPFVSDPRTILPKHGKNTPRDTMGRV